MRFLVLRLKKTLFLLLTLCQIASGKPIATKDSDAEIVRAIIQYFVERDKDKPIVYSEIFLRDGFLEEAARYAKLPNELSINLVKRAQKKTHELIPIHPQLKKLPNAVLLTQDLQLRWWKAGETRKGWDQFYEVYPSSSCFLEFTGPAYDDNHKEAVTYVVKSWADSSAQAYFFLTSKLKNGRWKVKERILSWKA